MTLPAYSLSNCELRALIYYLTPEEGGRKTPIRTKYRGQFYYEGKDWDAQQLFVDLEWCELGKYVDCYIQTLSPAFHFNKFYIGKEFKIREGSKVVGVGIITEILREEFEIKG